MNLVEAYKYCSENNLSQSGFYKIIRSSRFEKKLSRMSLRRRKNFYKMFSTYSTLFFIKDEIKRSLSTKLYGMNVELIAPNMIREMVMELTENMSVNQLDKVSIERDKENPNVIRMFSIENKTKLLFDKFSGRNNE